jgi:hypothetical protein
MGNLCAHLHRLLSMSELDELERKGTLIYVEIDIPLALDDNSKYPTAYLILLLLLGSLMSL